MADIEKVIKALEHCTYEGNCTECIYYDRAEGSINCPVDNDALALLKEQQAEIERLKTQKKKWLQNIADQQLAVSPTGYETEEGLAKRTGEWNGLQMAWEILTKE